MRSPEDIIKNRGKEMKDIDKRKYNKKTKQKPDSRGQNERMRGNKMTTIR